MTTFARTIGPFAQQSDTHPRQHDLDGTDHFGSLSESKVTFADSAGHNHSGTGGSGTPISHDSLLDKGTMSHGDIEAWQSGHLAATNPHGITIGTISAASASLPVALPETETAGLVNDTKYQLQAAGLAFVGRDVGDNPNSLIALLETDGSLLLDLTNNLVEVAGITSDGNLANSVIGQGYVANPWIHFKDSAGQPFNPNRIVKIRFGTPGTLGALPENVLLREAAYVGETEADMRGYLASLKGTGIAFDALPAADPQTGLNQFGSMNWLTEHVLGLEGMVSGGSGNLVYTSTVIASINASTETDPIALNKLPSIPESQITDGDLLARVGASETITQPWTFSNGTTIQTKLVIPNQTTMTSPTSIGEIKLKTDTKQLYASFDGSTWELAGGRPPKHFYTKGTSAPVSTMTLTDVVFGRAIGEILLIVNRGGIRQLAEEGQYTANISGNNIIIDFSADPVPVGIPVSVDVF